VPILIIVSGGICRLPHLQVYIFLMLPLIDYGYKVILGKDSLLW